MTKSSQKSVQIVYFFKSTDPEMQENIYLEHMNISCQPAATWLMFDIKHQPDRVLVDI